MEYSIEKTPRCIFNQEFCNNIKGNFLWKSSYKSIIYDITKIIRPSTTKKIPRPSLVLLRHPKIFYPQFEKHAHIDIFCASKFKGENESEGYKALRTHYDRI